MYQRDLHRLFFSLIILFMTQDSELDIPKQYIYTKFKKNMQEKKNEKNQIKSMLHIVFHSL